MDGLRIYEENGVRWFYKVSADATPQAAMFEEGDKRSHRAFVCKEVHIAHGKRAGQVSKNYASTTDWERFEQAVYSASRASRSYYEIIRGPCFLYLDIEWERGAPDTPSHEPAVIFDMLRHEICTLFNSLFGITLTHAMFYETDSSQGAKVSRHMLIKPEVNGVLYAFQNNHAYAYGFMGQLRKGLWERARLGEACAELFLCSKEHILREPAEECLAVFDMKVYTQNRIFRTLGSWKLNPVGSTKPIRIFERANANDKRPWTSFLCTHFPNDVPIVMLSYDGQESHCNTHQLRRTKGGRGVKQFRPKEEREDEEPVAKRVSYIQVCERCKSRKIVLQFASVLCASNGTTRPMCFSCADNTAPMEMALPSYDQAVELRELEAVLRKTRLGNAV
jgi:hypothetical protein